MIIRPYVDRGAHDVIIGNTCLYGATSGRLFAAGRAGQRFAVRNSGAETVVEGCGTNGCEYMTGGAAVILGPVGDNFAAGMTGGDVFLYDPDKRLESRLNRETVVELPLGVEAERRCRRLIETHLDLTGSRVAARILSNWTTERGHWVHLRGEEVVAREATGPENGSDARSA